MRRRTSLFNTRRLDHLYLDAHEPHARLFLHYGDMTDSSSLTHIIQKTQPDEIYNLAAQSHVAVSFEEPEYTANSDALGTLRLLEAVRVLGMEKRVRFYGFVPWLGRLSKDSGRSDSTFRPCRVCAFYLRSRLTARLVTLSANGNNVISDY